MNTTYAKMGDIERKMFKKFKLHPLKNYECCALLSEFKGMRATFNFDFSTDKDCEVINVKPRGPMAMEEILFTAIEYIKDESGSKVEIDLENEVIDKSLHEVCAGGDPTEVRQVLASDPDVNSDDWPSGFTPLHVCVSGSDSQDRQEIIKLLSEAGADVNMKDTQLGLTPLHYTGMRNKPLCAKTLIECGADINATEANGATALHGAAFHGNLEVSKVLLEGGANPKALDNYNNTPLSLAARSGHRSLCNLMEQYC